MIERTDVGIVMKPEELEWDDLVVNDYPESNDEEEPTLGEDE